MRCATVHKAALTLNGVSHHPARRSLTHVAERIAKKVQKVKSCPKNYLNFSIFLTPQYEAQVDEATVERYFCAAVAERESRCRVFSPSISLLAHRVGWVRSSAHHIPRLYRPKIWIYNRSLLFWLTARSTGSAGGGARSLISPQIGRKSLCHTGPLVAAGWGTGGIRNTFGTLSTNPRPTTTFGVFWTYASQSHFAILPQMTHSGSSEIWRQIAK